MTRWYRLVDRVPVPCAAGEFGDIGERRVNQTTIGPLTVSTVFLGLDHRMSGKGPPVLFETMVFGPGADDYQTRCSTWDEAEAMHVEAVGVMAGRAMADHLAKAKAP